MKELRKIDAKEGTKHAEAFERRAVSGGAFGDTGPIAAYTGNKKTMAEEFKGTGPKLERKAQALTRIGQMPVVGLKAPRKLYGRYTKLVFQDVNGAIERLAKKAMVGKAIKQGPLMERSLIDIGGKAAKEAARGLRETHNQIEAARGTVRAYGKYSQMSPGMREAILHTTPFIPWMLNMGKFLGDVMPRDHPVKTALTAAMNQGDQEWRMSKGLSFEGKNRRPDFLMGSYPVGKNKFVPVGRFGPFASADLLGDVAGQVAPQYTSALLNAVGGVDWKGNKIKGNLGSARPEHGDHPGRDDDPRRRRARPRDRRDRGGPVAAQEGAEAEHRPRRQEAFAGRAGHDQSVPGDRGGTAEEEGQEEEGQGAGSAAEPVAASCRSAAAVAASFRSGVDDGLPSRRSPQGPQVRAGPEHLRAPDPAGVRLQAAHRLAAGAQGIAQIMPATARGWGVDPTTRARRWMRRRRTWRPTSRSTAAMRTPCAPTTPARARSRRRKGYSETNNYVKTILGGKDPGKLSKPDRGGGGGGGSSSGRRGRPGRVNTTITQTPGVSNKTARGQLVASFLEDEDSDVLDFATQLKALKDIPGTSSTSRTRTPGRPGTRRATDPKRGKTGGGGARGKYDIKELFWQGAGGINVKDNQKVQQGFVTGHQDHVHVAAGKHGIVSLGKLAQQMGLHVGENPHFGGVAPVHVTNSNHYSGQAIDVSGDPAKMRKYAHKIARLRKG